MSLRYSIDFLPDWSNRLTANQRIWNGTPAVTATLAIWETGCCLLQEMIRLYWAYQNLQKQHITTLASKEGLTIKSRPYQSVIISRNGMPPNVWMHAIYFNSFSFSVKSDHLIRPSKNLIFWEPDPQICPSLFLANPQRIWLPVKVCQNTSTILTLFIQHPY